MSEFESKAHLAHVAGLELAIKAQKAIIETLQAERDAAIQRAEKLTVRAQAAEMLHRAAVSSLLEDKNFRSLMDAVEREENLRTALQKAVDAIAELDRATRLSETCSDEIERAREIGDTAYKAAREILGTKEGTE